MELVIRADTWLIWATTRLYWWVLDRTGLYVGTLMAACMAVCVARELFCYEGAVRWVLVFFDVIIFGVTSQIRWVEQHTLDTKVYNLEALKLWDLWPLRVVLVALLVGVTIIRVSGLGDASLAERAIDGAHGIALLMFSYLSCVLLRPRNPKKLWESEKELEPAPSLS